MCLEDQGRCPLSGRKQLKPQQEPGRAAGAVGSAVHFSTGWAGGADRRHAKQTKTQAPGAQTAQKVRVNDRCPLQPRGFPDGDTEASCDQNISWSYWWLSHLLSVWTLSEDTVVLATPSLWLLLPDRLLLLRFTLRSPLEIHAPWSFDSGLVFCHRRDICHWHYRPQHIAPALTWGSLGDTSCSLPITPPTWHMLNENSEEQEDQLRLWQ